MVVIVVRRDQLHADPDQQSGAHQFQERNLQQGQRERDQDHAQNNGADRAPDDALGTLRRRKLAARQRNHHGIVATQKDVDHDDLPDGDPEVGGQKFFHVVSLGWAWPQIITPDRLEGRPASGLARRVGGASTSKHGFEQFAHFRRIARHLEAAFLHDRQLGLGGIRTA